MESGINNKRLKVVWLCHFANKEMKDYFSTPKVNEFAPWINELINLFKGKSEIELHIVSPNVFTNKDCSFMKDGITYHFYKHIPIPKYNKYFKKIHTILKLEQYSNYYLVKNKVKKLINKINPDIIHLHGAENPYYSSTILPLIGKYPIITTIQGFIRNSNQIDQVTKVRIKIEEEILRGCTHFGTRTVEMTEVLKIINPQAEIHFHNYPLHHPKEIKDNHGIDEPIDCIFFARVCKDKGIEDLLEAIAIVKQKIPNINLHVIGGASKTYINFLKHKCEELSINENVKFLGFLPTQDDIFILAKQSKICVLPTYHDVIPGTIIESLLLKLPVIAYAVGGIPELNDKDEIILLVEKFNIEHLANSIILLLESDELRENMSEKAFNYINVRFNNETVIGDILSCYNKVMFS